MTSKYKTIENDTFNTKRIEIRFIQITKNGNEQIALEIIGNDVQSYFGTINLIADNLSSMNILDHYADVNELLDAISEKYYNEIFSHKLNVFYTATIAKGSNLFFKISRNEN